MFAVTAYAQLPWGKRIRSPVDVQGLASRVTALEAENDVLRAALLALYYDKQLALASNRANAIEQDEGWGPYVMNPSAPGGEKWILGTTYVANLDAGQIPETDAHIAALTMP